MDVGASLKKARTDRGLSLESVQQKIRIQRKFLEALEDNRFEELPGPVYMQGFLRTYCEFLDMDFDRLWSEVAEAPASSPSGAPARQAPRSERGGGRPVAPAPLLAGLFFGALIIVTAVLFYAVRPNQPQTPEPPPPRAAPPIQPLRPREAMTLDIRFRQRTWIRVEADGGTEFEGWAPAGAHQHWRAMERFLVRTPSPESVEAVVEGRPARLSAYPRISTGDFAIEAEPGH